MAYASVFGLVRFFHADLRVVTLVRLPGTVRQITGIFGVVEAGPCSRFM